MIKFYLKYFLYTLFIFLILFYIFYSLGNPKGIEISRINNTTLPKVIILKAFKTISFQIPVPKNSKYVFFPFIEGSSFSIKNNNFPIFTFGLGKSGRTWYTPFLIPIPKGVDVLTLEISGVYSIGLGKFFFINESEIWKYSILKFLTDNFLNISIGLISTLGFLLYLLSKNTGITRQKAYKYFAFSSFLAIIWLLDVISFEHFFYPLRKLFISCAYLSFTFLIRGIDLYNFSTIQKNTKRFSYLNILASILPLFTVTPQQLKTLTIFISPILILNGIFILYKIVKSYVSQNVTFASLFAITIIFDSIVLFFNLPFRMLSPFGIISLFLSFASSIILEYKEKIHELNVIYARSLIDPLTGACNRGFLGNIKLEKNDILIFIDLNKFKYINDTYGHDKGDEILKKLSSIIKSNLKSSDIFVRMGGDEFLIILKNSTKKEAEKLIKKIHNEFNKSSELSPTFSWGITNIEGSLKQSIRTADDLMYKMKSEKKASQ
ncbi:diguanylate cyclase [Thermosipho affectus]|uniref:Diguanylate cyclase n=1 Tax=Thermosipho affectus TaxID=660294 RepID=A0ABX3IH31_9BACT|nr:MULTISPECIES: GGDEF domain-containing protein [Thermosipho]ANQ53798.1 diguanylate cyclase [Thermosipho sp. 1070]APT72245.1 diguanylate cyclase [Thermosipho sp. 1063]ONN27149.1 diguanylate cyclase [Thermosipho affectus]